METELGYDHHDPRVADLALARQGVVSIEIGEHITSWERLLVLEMTGEGKFYAEWVEGHIMKVQSEMCAAACAYYKEYILRPASAAGYYAETLRELKADAADWELGLLKRVLWRSFSSRERELHSAGVLGRVLEPEENFDVFLIDWGRRRGGLPYGAHEAEERDQLINLYSPIVPPDMVWMIHVLLWDGLFVGDDILQRLEQSLDKMGYGLDGDAIAEESVHQIGSLVAAHVVMRGDFGVGVEAGLHTLATQLARLDRSLSREEYYSKMFNHALMMEYHNLGRKTLLEKANELMCDLRKKIGNTQMFLSLQSFTKYLQDKVSLLVEKTMVRLIITLRDMLIQARPYLSLETVERFGNCLALFLFSGFWPLRVNMGKSCGPPCFQER
eukprot:GHVR01058886.1.p1 GENE.GHVR01058886.1~~GHVR01058886.1.p1  ORF type:complete len:386 (+),score=30.65 GHVR01058886.1:1312-2469(+)